MKKKPPSLFGGGGGGYDDMMGTNPVLRLVLIGAESTLAETSLEVEWAARVGRPQESTPGRHGGVLAVIGEEDSTRNDHKVESSGRSH